MNEIDEKIRQAKEELQKLEIEKLEAQKKEQEEDPMTKSLIVLLEQKGYTVTKSGEPKSEVRYFRRAGGKKQDRWAAVEKIFSTQLGEITQKKILTMAKMNTNTTTTIVAKLHALASKYGWTYGMLGAKMVYRKGEGVSASVRNQWDVAIQKPSQPVIKPVTELKRRHMQEWLNTVTLDKPLTMFHIRKKVNYTGGALTPALLKNSGWEAIQRGRVTYYYPKGRMKDVQNYKAKSYVAPDLPALEKEYQSLLQNLNYAKRSNLMLVAWNNITHQQLKSGFQLQRQLSLSSYNAVVAMADEVANRMGFRKEMKQVINPRSKYKVNAVIYVR